NEGKTMSFANVCRTAIKETEGVGIACDLLVFLRIHP
ncbi:MAG: hypothetical protein ACI9HK_004005, partial [Pirellulaceae bacterium]